MKRRTVQKITPQRQPSFDQQFWPILVALTVLVGIASGAVVTLFKGPWMWAGLMGLPVFAIMALFFLFSIKNYTVRRSLQLAIIASLAIHILVILTAALTNIFENRFEEPSKKVVQRPVRTIEISDRKAAFIFEEPNTRPTPEPVVDIKREQETTTITETQPVPVIENKPEVNPQITPQKTKSQTVPRQSPELSQLKRQTKPSTAQPTISGKSTLEKQTVKQPANPNSPTTNDTARANTTQRQPASLTPQRVQSKSQNAPSETQISPLTSSASRAQITRSNQSLIKPTATASAASANIKRSDPRIPIVTKPSPTPQKTESATAIQPSTNQPSQSAAQLTRRPTRDRAIRPSLSQQPSPTLSRQPQIAKTVNRKSTPNTQPSISEPKSQLSTPKRSTIQSSIASTTVPVEKPGRSPESAQNSREQNSKTLSITRDSAGIAGSGKTKNLERFDGGETSPAAQASDSAKRTRSLSRADSPEMLTSSQKSTTRRSSGKNAQPTNILMADTTAPAKLAGGKTMGEKTTESSAASIDAAATKSRDNQSAAKGTSMIDLGATKVVSEQKTERRSGGGQTEISELNPESTRRSKQRSNLQPSIAADTVAAVSAPDNAATAPPSTEALDNSAELTVDARSIADSTSGSEKWAATASGEIADAGQTNVSNQLSDSRQKATQNIEDASPGKEEEQLKNQRGNQRTRLAQAPIIRSLAGTGEGTSESKSENSTTTPGNDTSLDAQNTRVEKQTAGSAGDGKNDKSAAAARAPAAAMNPLSSALARGNETENPDKTSNSNNTVASSTRAKQSPGARTQQLAPSIVATVKFDSANSKTGNNESQTNANVSGDSMAKIKRSENSDNSSLAFEVKAPEGPAGLGLRPAESAGIMERPAATDSQQLQPTPQTRFRSKTAGGTPALNPDAVLAQEAFQDRTPNGMSSAGEPTTEASIQLGLEFLARYQTQQGNWTLGGFDSGSRQKIMQLESDTAATGLAVLAFQGAGFNHREFQYANQIDRAIQWLVDNQSENGGLYVPSNLKSNNACRLYSHGIATLALTEAYGMTQDERLRVPVQKALDYIQATQDPRRGGWRYFDQPGNLTSDTSVSGWMMMALQSGRLAGLDVEPETFRSIDDWLEVAAAPDNPSTYRYDPFAINSKGISRIQGRKPTPSMTSVGLLMRIYSGWDKNDPRLLAGADYLLQTQLPGDTSPQVRDTYYWYYATQVLKFVDGQRWNQWNNLLRPMLIRSQEKSGDFAGSWNPYRPVPDRWGGFGGRLYVTTMNLLSLEVRHRMLPLYQKNN
ncbi:hypothetical protein N9B05_03345 [Mariniblastus sp.]|nr:hypothetical protein [Mariniblastus sp.]